MTELPDDWTINRLEDLCEPGKQAIVDGPFGSNLKRSDYVDSGIPVLKIQNIKENLITLKKMDYVKPEKYEELVRHSFTEGDIVMTKLGDPLGVSAIVNGIPNGLIVADLVRIRPSKILTKFLCYQLNSPRIQKYINEQQKGTTRPRVNLAMIRELPIYTPSIEVQHEIVELLEDHLSRLDAALADVKQAKIKAVQFRRSLLEEACTGRVRVDGTQDVTELPSGWELKRLGNCLEKLDSGKLAERGWSPQCLSHPVRNADTWGVLKTTAVQMGDYQPEYNKELPTSLAPKTGLEVKPGDFLVTTTGPRNRCGIVCHVKSSPRKLIFSGKILRFRANENIVLASWLMFVLMSPEYQKTFDRLKVGTSDSSVSIGNQQIIDLDIPVPPIAEQRKVIEMLEEHLSRLDATLAMADAMEKQTFALRRSVLQAAFTGQLTKEVVNV